MTLFSVLLLALAAAQCTSYVLPPPQCIISVYECENAAYSMMNTMFLYMEVFLQIKISTTTRESCMVEIRKAFQEHSKIDIVKQIIHESIVKTVFTSASVMEESKRESFYQSSTLCLMRANRVVSGSTNSEMVTSVHTQMITRHNQQCQHKIDIKKHQSWSVSITTSYTLKSVVTFKQTCHSHMTSSSSTHTGQLTKSHTMGGKQTMSGTGIFSVGKSISIHKGISKGHSGTIEKTSKGSTGSKISSMGEKKIHFGIGLAAKIVASKSSNLNKQGKGTIKTVSSKSGGVSKGCDHSHDSNIAGSTSKLSLGIVVKASKSVSGGAGGHGSSGGHSSSGGQSSSGGHTSSGGHSSSGGHTSSGGQSSYSSALGKGGSVSKTGSAAFAFSDTKSIAFGKKGAVSGARSQASSRSGAISYASGVASSKSGGANSHASGVASSKSGGAISYASGVASSKSGGAISYASGVASSKSGGANSYASDVAFSKSGGASSYASGVASSKSGGASSYASSSASSTGGMAHSSAHAIAASRG